MQTASKKRAATEPASRLIAVLLPRPPPPEWTSSLPVEPGLVWLRGSAVDDFDATALADVVGLVWVPPASAAELHKLHALCPRCAWIHSLSAGVDALGGVLPALRASGVALTNGRGAFSESLAEYVLAAALHFNKQFRRCERNRVERKWDKFPMDTVAGKTMGFVGYGNIAQVSWRRSAGTIPITWRVPLTPT